MNEIGKRTLSAILLVYLFARLVVDVKALQKAQGKDYIASTIWGIGDVLGILLVSNLI
jgi:hypothetical protein